MPDLAKTWFEFSMDMPRSNLIEMSQTQSPEDQDLGSEWTEDARFQNEVFGDVQI